MTTYLVGYSYPGFPAQEQEVECRTALDAISELVSLMYRKYYTDIESLLSEEVKRTVSANFSNNPLWYTEWSLSKSKSKRLQIWNKLPELQSRVTVPELEAKGVIVVEMAGFNWWIIEETSSLASALRWIPLDPMSERFEKSERGKPPAVSKTEKGTKK